jgi:hypothetical protein
VPRRGLPIYAGPNLYTQTITEVNTVKEKMMANLEQYRAVLDDLMKQRTQLQFKIGEIDSAVSALRRLMPIEDISPVRDAQQPLPIIQNGRYSGMSTRWAILMLLSEDATRPLSTGEIAEALQAGGIASSARNFAGNVSAVLSGMNHEKNEVIAGSNGWSISENGKNAWIHIKAARAAKKITGGLSSSEYQQPSLQ